MLSLLLHFTSENKSHIESVNYNQILSSVHTLAYLPPYCTAWFTVSFAGFEIITRSTISMELAAVGMSSDVTSSDKDVVSSAEVEG